MSKTYTHAQVAQHNTENDCWVIIDDVVYNMTDFLEAHPGGKGVVVKVAGTDATKAFNALHDARAIIAKYGKQLRVGVIAGSKHTRAQPNNQLSTSGPFGDGIPFGDPSWYTTFKSPYYTEAHKKWRARVRAFVEKEIMPYTSEWEDAKSYPRELHVKAYEAGLYGAPFPVEYGGTPPEGGFDVFHDVIYWDEIARCACGGLLAACFLTLHIGFPPLLSVGSDYIKNKCAKDIITGKKLIALAITEPYGGSDVAAIRTTAERQGDFYIVNGEKKFITGGMRADYFTVAVRTGGKGMGGISLLLLEKGMPGINLRRQKTQGWWTSTTTFVQLENVKVPVKNIIGQENQGFLPIMLNFNHERMVGLIMAHRSCRICIEESIKFARNRKTFGKRLIDNQVIRHKIAEMARHTEATWAWIESLAYQMQQGLSPLHLGGQIALCKVQTSRTLEYCAREACQIFGGASYLRTGVGAKIERIWRELRVSAIGGGSEEVMIDLAMRMAKL
mmetsp:Transcript_6816/g.7463  ORF Transcript_6816/g.7463 Transcript_6816/m.7463 type:complete len:502 (+) Transcript_6816:31-1536(+)